MKKLNAVLADTLSADVLDAWARVRAGIEWIYVWAFVVLVLSILWAVRGLRADVDHAVRLVRKAWDVVTRIMQRTAAEPADDETLPHNVLDEYFHWRGLALDAKDVIVEIALTLRRFVIQLLRWMLVTSLLTMPCTLMLVLAPPLTWGPDGLGLAPAAVICNWCINAAMLAILFWLARYFLRLERGPVLQPFRPFAALAAKNR